MPVALDSDARPTWGLVVVLVLTIFLETLAEWWTLAEIDYDACVRFCDGAHVAVKDDACFCVAILDEEPEP